MFIYDIAPTNRHNPSRSGVFVFAYHDAVPRSRNGYGRFDLLRLVVIDSTI